MPNRPPAGRPPFAPSLAEAVGHVVLEAARCEDTFGELVILHQGVADRPDGDWWTSGERLAEAVSSLDDPEAADMARTYRSLLDDRHRIVHGLWLGSGEGYVNVLRGKSVKKDPQRPNYDMGTATEKAILNVAAAFNQLEARASDAVTRHMGLH